jgi:hypothetical protein
MLSVEKVCEYYVAAQDAKIRPFAPFSQRDASAAGRGDGDEDGKSDARDTVLLLVRLDSTTSTPSPIRRRSAAVAGRFFLQPITEVSQRSSSLCPEIPQRDRDPKAHNLI